MKRERRTGEETEEQKIKTRASQPRQETKKPRNMRGKMKNMTVCSTSTEREGRK